MRSGKIVILNPLFTWYLSGYVPYTEICRAYIPFEATINRFVSFLLVLDDIMGIQLGEKCLVQFHWSKQVKGRENDSAKMDA